MNKGQIGVLSRLKGNRGEFAVATALSEQCYVRPVIGGSDTGIDLYCETVDADSGQPFLHFWVQVKSGGQVRCTKKGTCCSLGTDDIEYWLRQPVPVYVFLAPDGELSSFSVISFARQHAQLKGSALKKESSKRVYADFTFDTTRVDEFLEKVRRDYAIRAAQTGVSIYLPQLKETYIRTPVQGVCSPYVAEIVDTIRRSASAGIADTLDACAKPIDIDQQPLLKVLLAVMGPFTSAKNRNDRINQNYPEVHWEDYVAVGRLLKQLGQDEKGNEMLNRAIHVIETDPKFQEDMTSWGLLCREISSYK